MASVGKIGEFCEGTETFSCYSERLEQFIEANGVANDKLVPVFLSVIGPKAYGILRNLVSPALPKEKSYAELVKVLGDHYEPKPLVISERFRFYKRNQREGECVADYVVELKRLSSRCEFGTFLEEALRDRFVCGLQNESTQKKLLAERDLTFEKSIQIGTAMEMAEKGTEQLQPGMPECSPVNVVKPKANWTRSKWSGPRGGDTAGSRTNSRGSRTVTECFRCGNNHNPDFCRFKTSKCFACNKIGHVARKCPNTQNVRSVEETGNDSESEPLYSVYMHNTEKTKGHLVTMKVGEENMNFEVDTGSAVSIIPVSVYKTHLSEYKIQNTSMTLKGYSGTRIKIVGTVDVPVTHYGQSKILPLIIAEDKGPCLVGRDWLDKLILDWRSVFSVQRVYAVDELLLDFPEIFDVAVSGIKNFKAQIRVKDGAQPIFHKARPVPYSLKGQVEKELHRLEKEGIISKVEHSDWAAPIVVVPKSDGSIRICGDYKVTVNRTVPDEPYPIPNTDDLFATLAGGEKFTKLDLSHAYSQLELDSNSMEYLTVNTHVGLYQFNRLAYGVSSAPAIFQGVMDRVLNGIEGVVCRIDDILITAPSDEEHIKRLTDVLNRLKTHNIKLKKEKCTFMNDRVTYMGHVIDKEGIHPTNEKVQALQNAPTPTNVTELKSYLGLLNYYGAFLPDLSTILEPLHNLLRKNARWAWDKDCENSFVKTKELVLKCDLLVHYDTDKPLKLACDASPYGVGCVLSHIIDGEERPIAFGSRTMTSSEKNYSQLEREALAIIYGVKKFHKYLYGRRFVLVTDNKPLSTILGPKKGVPTLAAARLQRWALILSAYDYEIECRKSADHSNCDSLSRLPLEQRWPDENTDFEDSKDEDWEVYFAVRNDGVPISSREVASATRTDPILSRVYSYTMNGWPSYVKDPGLKPYFVRRSELSTDHGVVLWGMRVVIPTKLRAGVLAELHEEHIGMSRMKSLARSYVWWPNMDTLIEDVVSHCQVCQSVRKSAQPAPLMPWEYTSRPWQRIHVDFASFKQQSFLVVTDSYSKWLEVIPMKSTTSERTVEELRSMCASWGIPEVIVSDNGPQFISAEFREFTRRNGIRHKLIPPWHPSSNGAAERAVQVLKQALKTQVVDVGNSNLSLRHRLARFLFKYRTVPHTVTGESPSSLFMKRELRSRLTLLRPNQAENIHTKQKTLDASNMERKGRAYVVGDTVSVKKYSQGGKWVWESGVVNKLPKFHWKKGMV